MTPPPSKPRSRLRAILAGTARPGWHAAAALAEGRLVYGERLDGHVPEDKARSVHGVDPLTVVHLRVEKRGPEYWAVWGKRADSGLVR